MFQWFVTCHETEKQIVHRLCRTFHKQFQDHKLIDITNTQLVRLLSSWNSFQKAKTKPIINVVWGLRIPGWRSDATSCDVTPSSQQACSISLKHHGLLLPTPWHALVLSDWWLASVSPFVTLPRWCYMDWARITAYFCSALLHSWLNENKLTLCKDRMYKPKTKRSSPSCYKRTT